MHNSDDLMPFDLPKKEIPQKRTIIKVIGVGGGGGNAVNNMYEEGIENVDFVIANTDIQVLEKSPIEKKIQLGYTLTEGLGAGNDPEKGKNAATESKQEIIDLLSDTTKMVFVTAGMGGGTGTGAAPVIAQTAKDLGILTIGIVSIPFSFEGNKRIEQAIVGLNELKQHVDAMIIINNEKISEVYAEYDIVEAFRYADQVLTIAAKGIAEIITKPGIVNVDFADVKSVMKDSGVAVMGTGYGEGEKRAINAVKEAISSPLLNNNDIKGAKNLLVNIISPAENRISTLEIKEINEFLQNEAGNKANLIWGVTLDASLEKDQAAVTVVATDFYDNIIPEIGDNYKKTLVESNKIEETEITDEEELELENGHVPTIEEIKNRIRNQESQKFDYTDDNTVDKYEKNPAYLRQQLKIEFKKPSYKDNDNGYKLGNSHNDFLNPMMD